MESIGVAYEWVTVPGQAVASEGRNLIFENMGGALIDEEQHLQYIFTHHIRQHAVDGAE